MKLHCCLYAAAALALPLPAAAQTAVDQKNVTAEDVATKPLADMNLRKDEIPALLVQARAAPYDLTGLTRCSSLGAAVTALDAVLGDDIDLVDPKTTAEKRGNSIGNIGKSLIGSLIPFGGVIREVSGANAAQREWNEAIYAGSVRRAFLKGVGQHKGCALPARAATTREAADISARREAERLAAEAAKDAAKDAKKKDR
jgi:hypothetical protein